MSRYLPVLCFLLFSAAASANQSPATEEPAAKPGKTVVATSVQDGDATPSVHASAPTRSASQRTPRWHSLLPGMIR